MSARATALVITLVTLTTACTVPSRPVSPRGGGAYEASLARIDGDAGFLVAWHDHRHGRAEIYLRQLDPDGRALGPSRRLTDTPAPSYEPDLVSVGTDSVVAWYEAPADGTSRASVGRWSLDGVPRWIRPLAPDGSATRNPVVRRLGSRLFCAWLEEVEGAWRVRARWLSTDGQEQSPSLDLAPASATTWNLNAATLGDHLVWVTFDADVGTRAHEIFVTTVEEQTSRTVRLSADDGLASTYPDLAAQGTRQAVTWFDERDGNREIYLAVGVDTREEGALEPLAQRVTHTPGASIGAYLAWNRNHLGLAWSDDGAGGPADIYLQTFDAAGVPFAPARRLTTNPTASLIPAIRPARAGFALTWNEDVVERRGDHEMGGVSQVRFRVVE